MPFRAAEPDDWDAIAWMWQAYRNDLAPIVHGFPLPDGRYNTAVLDSYRGSDLVYLAVQPHPNVRAEAPVGFAIVDDSHGHDTERLVMAAFWTAPAARRQGLGRDFALDVLARHGGRGWSIAFQHDNVAAGHFWRRVAIAAFGPEGEAWTETTRAVEGRPDVPPDHYIETHLRPRTG